jgi:transcriptional regulator of arginine metabolism
MSAHKRYRQGQILKLISTETIHNQDELRRRLLHLKLRVTQATLSRDLTELQIIKTAQGYKPLSAAAPEPATGAGPTLTPLARALREFLLDLRPAQNLLVLKTPPGGAQPIAFALDAEKWKEIAGTIAGDDTILIVTPNPRTRAAVQKRMEDLL